MKLHLSRFMRFFDIFVAKTRNCDIFVAKIYDYVLIDSFWGFPRFIDSPTSYATLFKSIFIKRKRCKQSGPKKCNFRYYIMLFKISISVRLRRVGYIYEKITVWLIWNIVSAKVPRTTELSSDKAGKIPQSLHNFFSRSHFSRQENIVSSVLKWHECASF